MPFEMITMLGSTVLGGVMSIWSQSIKAKQAELEQLGPSNNQLEIMRKRNKFKAKKSYLEQKRKDYLIELLTAIS